ncbi:hypothetical protein Mal15_22340 [Stieleria maiorica]|uniref:Uncharacterized protein n=2 Tax=Stieleria maiorica TaxID=2795974 RepID=A0A5B9MF65_9BACT|nr:hypothetical protein Mal15_22340 [Stieleria maiorica]
MTTFFTAMLWGAGVSTGMTLGVVGWFVTIELCKWLRGDTKAKRQTDDHNERALAELKRRNEIGEAQLECMESIADHVDAYTRIKAGG